MQSTKSSSGKRQTSTAKSREGSVAFIIRQLIAKGRTNDDIFATLKKRGLLDESKRHWPQWYRRQMILRKDISRRFAEQHMH